MQEVVSVCKKEKKTLYFTMFWLPERSKNRQNMVQKRTKIDFQKHLMILPVVPHKAVAEVSTIGNL